MRVHPLPPPPPTPSAPKLRSSTAHVLMPDLSDPELVERVARGDSWAEEVVYRRYASQVLRTAKRLLCNPAEAEDVTQDTFITAFEIWGQLRDPARLKHWLLRIAVRKVHRHFRRRQLLRALGFVAPAGTNLEQSILPHTSAEVRAELLLLDKALGKVSPGDRIAWMLRYVEGLSLGEVAYECSCSLATTKRRIASAQKALGAVQLETADE